MPAEAAAPEICLCAALRRAARTTTRLYDELMEPSGLKVTQFSLLRNVARAGRINVTDLAQKLDLERTAMSRNLAVLRRRKLVRDVAGEDLRDRTVTLTKAGERAIASAEPVWRAAQQAMRARWQAGEFPALQQWLQSVTSSKSNR